MPIDELGKTIGSSIRSGAGKAYDAVVAGASQNIENMADQYSTAYRMEQPVRAFKSGVVQGISGLTPATSAPAPSVRPSSVATSPANPMAVAPMTSVQPSAALPAAGPQLPRVADYASGGALPLGEGQGTMMTSDGRKVTFGGLQTSDGRAEPMVAEAAYAPARPSAYRAPPVATNLPYRQGSTPLGGLYSAVLALAGGRALNNQARMGMNRQIAAGEANQRAAEGAARLKSTDLANTKTQFDLDRQTKLAALDQQIAADDGKDPALTKRLTAQRLALVGKAAQDNKFQVSQYEEPIDPANPMAGTRKIPVLIDAQGNTKFVRPSQAAGQNTRAEAEAAIAQGADPAVVKARYKEMTGQAY
jgi:hypothetical protein